MGNAEDLTEKIWHVGLVGMDDPIVIRGAYIHYDEPNGVSAEYGFLAQLKDVDHKVVFEAPFCGVRYILSAEAAL